MTALKVEHSVMELPQENFYITKKKFKTSELPLTATQRSTIEGLQHTIKKKGEWDALRKKVWSEFIESDEKKAFTERLNELAEAEIDRDPSLLSRERGKAAAMMQGPIDRTDIYKSIESSLEDLIAKHLNHIYEAAREVRRADIGEEAVAKEEALGNKTDEEYAREAAVRREAREAQRKQEEARKRRQEEKERLQEEEEKKKAELERLRKADLRRKEVIAINERREKERQEREEARKLQEEKERESREQNEQSRREDTARNGYHSQYYERDRSPPYPAARHQKSREPSHSRTREPSPGPPAPQVDEKALEEAALELLIREGRANAAKFGSRTELERSESLEPPLRKSQMLRSKSNNRSPSKPLEDHRSPSKLESLKPKLSYSITNTIQEEVTHPSIPPTTTETNQPVPLITPTVKATTINAPTPKSQKPTDPENSPNTSEKAMPTNA
ncbi:MAG: hypothetical protein Q9190_007794 [Brigantiaea leucoxantha]